MSNKQLYKLTKYIVNEIIRNDRYILGQEELYELLDVIASLHNLLCEAVTGNRYNYMYHWSNKEGYSVVDDLFDEFLTEEKNED